MPDNSEAVKIEETTSVECLLPDSLVGVPYTCNRLQRAAIFYRLLFYHQPLPQSDRGYRGLDTTFTR